MYFATKDLAEISAHLRLKLRPKTVIGISGTLGAGKTTLISEVLKDQNVDVASPTYALHHSYQAFGLTIIHVDLYRAESAAEVDSTGFWDLFANADSALLVEWIERVDKNDLPFDWNRLFLKIEVSESGQRRYILETAT